MNQFIYREVKEKDYEQIENLIAESFFLNEYVPEGETLNELKKTYLRSCLTEATYKQVAELDGIIVGVIMGYADKDFNIFGMLFHSAETLFHGLKTRLAANEAGFDSQPVDKLFATYKKLIKGRSKNYNGILTLFIVNEKFRGTGVGSTLLQRVETYFQDNNVKKFYLYTDTTCNFEYYEHHGFDRANEETIAMNFPTGNKKMTVYLYDKQLLK